MRAGAGAGPLPDRCALLPDGSGVPAGRCAATAAGLGDIPAGAVLMTVTVGQGTDTRAYPRSCRSAGPVHPVAREIARRRMSGATTLAGMSSESAAGARRRDRRRGAGGIQVGAVGGVPIIVAPSWVASVGVIAALGVPVVAQVLPGTGTALAIVVSIALGVLLGASVLAHELGHCLAARLVGTHVVGVRLYLLGGVSELARTPRSPRDEAVIAAAGPAVSGALAGAFWLVSAGVTHNTVPWLLLVLLALSNAVVAIFNLLPALPLDGGRVLRAAVWKASSDRRAGTTVAVYGGYLIAVALAIWAAVLMLDAGADAALPAGIGVAMALFVAAGAASERNPRRARPVRGDLSAHARPVVRIPAESPVTLALEASAGHAVLLTEEGGVARGLLDVAAASLLAQHQPQAPASLVAKPVSPRAVILADDDPADIAERARTTDEPSFLLVDESGAPTGVLDRAQLTVLTADQVEARRRRFRSGGTPAANTGKPAANAGGTAANTVAP